MHDFNISKCEHLNAKSGKLEIMVWKFFFSFPMELWDFDLE